MLGIKSEEKKTASKDYTSMMSMTAWEDLKNHLLNERDLSMKRIDSKSASDLTLGEVCEERGFRKGIMKILQFAEQRREGV